jgi:hypothetical protein
LYQISPGGRHPRLNTLLRNTDITRIPPYGTFICIHKEHRDLKDQSFGLTSIQEVFIGIAHHRKTLGYCITDGTRVSCIRPHFAFDPYLYPIKRNSVTSVADVSQFHNSETTGRHQGFQRPAKDHGPATQGGAAGQLRRIFSIQKHPNQTLTVTKII